MSYKQFVQTQTKESSQSMTDALINLYQSGQIIKTESVCRQLLQTYPQSLIVYSVLGAALKGQGKLQEAVQAFDKAIELKPDYAPAYNNRGTVLHKLGQLEEAVANYDKAIELKPDYAEAYSNRGSAFQELGQLEEAVASCDKAIELRPDYAQAYSNRGIALQALGQLEKAVVAYNNAIEFKPDYVKTYNNRGVALQDLGQLEEAVESYNKAIELNPDYTEAYNNLAHVFNEQGKLDEAVQTLQMAFKKKPDNFQVSESLIKILNYHLPSASTRGSYARAQEALSRVIPIYKCISKISDEIILQLYQQCHSILAFHGLHNKKFSESQIWRGIFTYKGCNRHKAVFDTYKIIPKYCFNCYKVSVEPRTVVELFKLMLIFDSIELPKDNTRKCIVEIRPDISGAYKGLIYCQNLVEANEILEIVKTIVDDKISKKIPISVKRGCSEYTIAYPEFGQIENNEIPQMTYNEEWRRYEDNIDKNLLRQGSATCYHSYNHLGFTLCDTLIMRNWLTYASDKGDTSYFRISKLSQQL